MKPIIILLLSYFLISNSGYAQSSSTSAYSTGTALTDSSQNSVLQKMGGSNYHTHVISSDTFDKPDKKNIENDQQSTIYMDTRLGSSSKMYDTYEKNDYGAGAITTNPNK